MGKKSIVVFVIVILGVSIAYGQEQNHNQELLSWLPKGDYECIETWNVESFDAQEQPSYLQFKAIIGPLIKAKMKSLPLPEKFISSNVSFTLARLSGYSLMSDKELEEKNKPENRIGSETNLSPIVIAFKTDDGRRVFQKLYHETVYLWIYAFDDVADLILNEKKSGVLTSEKKYREQDIFSFTPISGGRFYLSPTHTNLLLVTREKKYLEAMIRTGLGEEESILDSPVWKESIDQIEELGSNWMISDLSLRSRIQLAEEKKLGAPQERIEYLENSVRKAGKFKQMYYEFGEQMVQREILWFEDEDLAKGAYVQTAASIQKERERADTTESKTGKYARAVFGNMRCDLDGKSIIISRFMGEEYLKMEKADSLRRKRLAEKEAKKNRSKSK